MNGQEFHNKVEEEQNVEVTEHICLGALDMGRIMVTGDTI